MACEEPRTAYQDPSGGPLFWRRPQHLAQYKTLEIPCNTCILCREEQARQQAVRIYHEAQLHDENCFVTLTYKDEHLPEYNSLNYEHLQNFWKRIKIDLWRKEKLKLRYYSVGEYGDVTNRPHYHACIFGNAFLQQRTILRRTPNLLWTNPYLERIWGFGQVSVGILNFQTARYTASYVTKKLRSKQQYVRIDQETGELIPLQQPRAFMSRNLGKGWWEKHRHQVSAWDHVIINGKRQKPPKAYDRWLGEVNDIPLGMIKTQRLLHAEPETQSQRRARARNAHARGEAKTKII